MATQNLKVYGGNLDGVHRVIMACTSLTAFYKATSVSRGYASETREIIACGVALNEPGIIFVQNVVKGDGIYRRVGPEMSWATIRVYDQQDSRR